MDFFYILDTVYFNDLAFVPRVNVAPQDREESLVRKVTW